MAPDSATANLGALASRFIEVDKLPWIETSPGSQMKVLMHDEKTGMLTVLSKLAPGGSIPMHVHEDLEQTLLFGVEVFRRVHGFLPLALIPLNPVRM